VDEAPTIAAPPEERGGEPDQGDAAHPARRIPEVRWDRWFLVVAILFGVFLAVGTPPLQEHDAIGHLVRVDRMSRGTFVEPLDADGQTSAPIDGCLNGFIRTHTALGLTYDHMRLRDNWRTVRCERPTSLTISTSALTSPVPYMSNLVGYAGAKALGAGIAVRVLAARLTSLAAYVAAVWFALRLAPKGRAVLFAVAVLPSSLALAAGVHADSTGIAAAILAVALTLRARERPSRGVLVALAVSLVVVALAKNLYSPLVLLVLLVPAGAFADRWARRRYVAVTGLAAGLAVAAWSSYVARTRYVLPGFGIDSEKAQTFVVHHPLSFLASMWRGLWDPFVRETTLPGFVEVLGGMRGDHVGHVYGDLPPLAIFWVAVAVLALAVFADPGRTPRSDPRARRLIALVIGVIVVATVLLIYLGMALTANAPGTRALVWAQGRYFIPIVPLLAFAAGRRLRLQPEIALAVPAGSLFLLTWVAWRLFVVFS
jgi:hypothetical protein